MSSKPEAQNEPTMEEILASIRRIISEDEPQGGKPADEIPLATPPAAAKAQAEPAAAAHPESALLAGRARKSTRLNSSHYCTSRMPSPVCTNKNTPNNHNTICTL